MADLDFVDETLFDPDEAPITEPPKRWRNKWTALVTRDVWCNECRARRHLTSGEDFWSCVTFPSEDIARTKAIDALEEDIRAYGTHRDRHVGVFPESERP